MANMSIIQSNLQSFSVITTWNGSSFDWVQSYACDSDLLVVRISGDIRVLNVSYGGITCTQRVSAIDSSSGQSQIFDLVSPPSGSNDLVIDSGSGTRQFRAITSSLTGVGVLSHISGIGSDNGFSASATSSIDTGSGDLVLDVIGVRDITASSGVGQNETTSGEVASSTYIAYTSDKLATGTSTDMSWAFSSSGFYNHASIGYTKAEGLGPTLTGPDSTTDGTNTVETGTLLDTVTIQSLVSGSYEVIQTIDTQVPTQLEYIANSGVNDCVPGTPVAGVPLEETITAPGITPYIVQQKVDDGVNSPTTRDITLNAPATNDVIQTMIASANTIDDQSIFGTSWIDVEDSMQVYVPKVVDGVNFTWAADGTFTTDQDKTVNVRVPYFAPSTGQYGCINFTIQGSSIKPTGVNKNKRQSLTYQFYYNKNWRDKFQGGVN